MFGWFKKREVWNIKPYDWERKEKFERYKRFGILAESMQEALELEGVPKIGDVITIQMVCESIDLQRDTPATFHARVHYREIE